MRYPEIEREIRRKYAQHKASAKQRGVGFSLTFDQWWELWAPHWHKRGRGPNDMQMCRTRDEGGYTPGNVRIDTQRSNASERGVKQRVNRASSSMRGGAAISGLTQSWLASRHNRVEISLQDDLCEEE